MNLNLREVQAILSALRRLRETTSIESRQWDFVFDLRRAIHRPMDERELQLLENRFKALVKFQGSALVEVSIHHEQQPFDLGGES